MLRQVRNHLLFSAFLLAMLPLADGATTPNEVPTNPGGTTRPDTDGDGLDDDTERRLGLNHLDPTDGLSDNDKDGLTYVEEWKAGTNQNKADTDGDGIGDLEEILQGTSPTNPNDPPRGPAGTPTKPPPRTTINLLSNGKLDQRINSTFRFNVASFDGRYQIDLVPSALVEGWKPVNGSLIEVWRNSNTQFIELCATPNDFGIKQELINPALGGYVLCWKSAGRPASHGGSNAYWVKVTRKDGYVILSRKMSATPQVWTMGAVFFQVTAADRLAGVTVSFVPADTSPAGVMLDDIALVKGGLEVDYNRDGTITAGEIPPRGLPQRHWINDDQDETDCEGDDIDTPGTTSWRANWQVNGINGQRDLVDYFSVNLAIAEVVRLLPPADGYRYSLRQVDRAVNFAYTSQRPTEARLHHEMPGLHRFRDESGEATKDVLHAWVHRLSDTGEMPIDEAWLARIEQTGHGLILVEGARETKNPLQVVVTKGGLETLVISLPLEIVPVESMYRSVDLTGVCRDYQGNLVTAPIAARPNEVGNPKGLPDAELSDGWVVFLHGYNVDAQRARGWHAEVFKRLYVMGSRARFVGVTWYGNTGMRVDGTCLDDHQAVFNALQTGDQLKAALGFLDPAKTTVVAHSLGNMVACQAIQKTGLTPRRYLMLNAAVPTEAFASVPAFEVDNMVEKDWRGKGSTFAADYFTSNWHKRFPANDPRSKLKWSDLFDRMRTGGFAINCYSGGDDIVRCPEGIDSVSIVQQVREDGFAAWKSQELLKGLRWSESIASWGMSRDQAGWSRKRFGPAEQPDPAYNPYFRQFLEPGMTSRDINTARTLLSQPLVVYDLYARALPALSYGAGAQRIVGFNKTSAIDDKDADDLTNYNFEAKGRFGSKAPLWPTVNHGNQADPKDQRKTRWLHSDFRNTALPFVSPAFKYFISQIN
jgi:hypothetical protein